MHASDPKIVCVHASARRALDMALTHRGMRISNSDWEVFLGHAATTLAKFQVPEAEQRDVVAFVQGLRNDCVEC